MSRKETRRLPRQRFTDFTAVLAVDTVYHCTGRVYNYDKIVDGGRGREVIHVCTCARTRADSPPTSGQDGEGGLRERESKSKVQLARDFPDARRLVSVAVSNISASYLCPISLSLTAFISLPHRFLLAAEETGPRRKILEIRRFAASNLFVLLRSALTIVKTRG